MTVCLSRRQVENLFQKFIDFKKTHADAIIKNYFCKEDYEGVAYEPGEIFNTVVQDFEEKVKRITCFTNDWRNDSLDFYELN